MNFRNEQERALFEAGMRHQAAQQPRGNDQQLQQAIAHLQNQSERAVNRAVGSMRKELREEVEKADRRLADMARIADGMSMMRDGGDSPGVVRIEDIPGRRVPFTLLVDIPISSNTTSVRQQSVTISQEGPFVAVKRMAIFQSAYEYAFTNDVTGQTARLAGRSFGRYRPIHSAYDLCDSQHAQKSDSTAWFLAASAGPPAAGTPLPTGTLAMPSNMSSFRTMEFDGRITIINAGSSFPRQNIPVPSSMWSPQINAPFELGALDFFERGEVLTLQVQPTHVNNPPVGNVDGECIFPAAAAAGFLGYPFVGGQYDSHEGICTPNGVVMGDSGDIDDWEPSTSDPVSRLPDGILTIGWEGYRIIQPVGPIG
jgi:hypothetical protein